MNTLRLTRNELERIVASEGGPHLSLYLPPSVGRNESLEEERIRFRNLVRSARELLTKDWMPDSEAGEFLRPLEILEEQLQQNPRSYSVAAFVSGQFHGVFRLDQEQAERLVIARSFHVRPLLPCLDEPDPYVVVTLSQQRVALFASTPTGLEPVNEFMPESFEKTEAELTVPPKTQVRAAVVGGRGGQGAVFHGQGDLRDEKKVDLENYLRHIDASLCSYLRPREGTRLILAGVDSLTAMYQAISQCDNIVKQTLSGNVDHLSVDELQMRVEVIAGDELHEQRTQKGALIREHDVPTATDPEQVLVAAAEGRIDTLFIDQDAQLNGSFLADQGTLREVQRQPTGAPGDSDHDLVEWAAVQTIKTGGTVYAVPAKDMPVAKRMAAALRY